MKQLLSNIWTWEWFSPEKQYLFNGLLVGGEKEKKVIIDPVKMSEETKKTFKQLGPYEAIYLTNRDHERIAYDLRREFDIPIWIYEADKSYLKEEPDFTFKDKDKLLCGIEVMHFIDQKSPGESAFYIMDRKIIILGDALIGNSPGRLNLLPETKYKDVKKAKNGLEKLCTLSFDVILVGDGEPILSDAKEALEKFFVLSKELKC